MQSFLGRHRAPQYRLRFLEAPILAQEIAEIVQADRGRRMIRAESFLGQLERAAERVFRFSGIGRLRQRHAFIAEACDFIHDRRVCGTWRQPRGLRRGRHGRRDVRHCG